MLAVLAVVLGGGALVAHAQSSGSGHADASSSAGNRPRFGPGGDPSGSGGGTTGRSGGAGAATYHGSATLKIGEYDYCDLGADPTLRNTETFTYDATVDVVARHSDGDIVESNPYGLLISVGDGNQAYSISIASAEVATTPDTGRHVLLQWWRFTDDGGKVHGELTDRNSGIGGALNSVQAPKYLTGLCTGSPPDMYLPNELEEGTTFEGTIDGSTADLHITGRSYDHSTTFDIQLSAST